MLICIIFPSRHSFTCPIHSKRHDNSTHKYQQDNEQILAFYFQRNRIQFRRLFRASILIIFLPFHVYETVSSCHFDVFFLAEEKHFFCRKKKRYGMRHTCSKTLKLSVSKQLDRYSSLVRLIDEQNQRYLVVPKKYSLFLLFTVRRST